MTTITVSDPALIAQLLNARGGELRDPSGQLLVTFATPVRARPAGMTRADATLLRQQWEAAVAKVEAEPLDETRTFAPPPGFKHPFSDEELEQMSQRKVGRPLLDRLREMEELP